MTEYITKEQALEAVKGKMWPGEIEAAIKAIPAADVVEEANIINDPFPALFEAFGTLYKDADKVETYLVTADEFDLYGDDGEPALGFTLFPDDGSYPVIYVSAELPFKDVVEIVAHEMAHVIAGQDAEHDETWEQAFSDIHLLYGEIYDKNIMRILKERDEE